MPTFKTGKSVNDIEEPVLMPEDFYLMEIATKPEIGPNKAKQNDPTDEKAGDNLILKLKVCPEEGEFAGRRFNLNVPWPRPEDEDLYDGIGMKISDAKMQRLALITLAFGGSVDEDEIFVDQGMRAYVRVTLGLDQSGQKPRNNIELFNDDTFKSIAEVQEAAAEADEGQGSSEAPFEG